MTIETKYNVGDRVWTNVFRQQILEFEIDEIKIMVKHETKVWSIDYLVNGSWLREEEFEPTKEELLKSL